MCDISLALVAASTALSSAGQIQQGQATSAAHKANATLFEQQARQEEQKALLDANTERFNFRRHIGSVRAAVGGSGASSANFSEVFNDDLLEAERDVAIIKQGGNNRAANLRTQSANERSRSRSARTAGFISAASTFVGGVSRARQLR